MRISLLPDSQFLCRPKNWEKLSGSQLILKSGLAHSYTAGIFFWSPLLLKMLNKLIFKIRELCELKDFYELKLPLLVGINNLVLSGAYQKYSHEFYHDENFAFSPTSEENFIEYASSGLQSYRQLPISLYSFKDAFRNIKRPHGFYKAREFYGCVMFTVDTDSSNYKLSLERFRFICCSLWGALGFDVYEITSADGKSIEYFYEGRDGDENSSPWDSIADKNAKYSSLAMGYPCKKSLNFSMSFMDDEGKRRIPFVGTFGIGLQRCLCAVFEKKQGPFGIVFPDFLRIYNTAIIPISSQAVRRCDTLYKDLNQKDILLDDRIGLSLKTRLEFCDFLGIKKRIICGKKEIAMQKFELREIGNIKRMMLDMEEIKKQLLGHI